MKLLRDTWLIFVRNVRATLRNPVWVFVGLTQPVFFLALFAPLLQSLARTPGFPPGGALNVFTPGLLIQLGLFTAYVGFSLIAELRAGVVERMRVTPVSRLALLLGRALRDVVILLIQGLVLILVAVPFGLKVDPAGLVETLGLLALLGCVMAACSYALALALRSEDALAPLLNMITMPMMLLSGMLLPLTLAPAWLRNIAAANPLAYAVSAARALVNGRLGDLAVPQGFAILAVLAVLALAWATASFRQAAA